MCEIFDLCNNFFSPHAHERLSFIPAQIFTQVPDLLAKAMDSGKLGLACSFFPVALIAPFYSLLRLALTSWGTVSTKTFLLLLSLSFPLQTQKMGLLYVLFLFGSLVIYAVLSSWWGVTQFIVAGAVTPDSIFWAFFADVLLYFYSVILSFFMSSFISFQIHNSIHALK